MQSCPGCRHENPAQAKFCLECGTALALASCSRCGVELPSSAKFCLECGAPASGSQQPPGEQAAPSIFADGERRHLTVLFCDLVDSTSVASRLDAEDWRDVVRRFQSSASEVIERFEGYVAQYLGDGVLVYFGYPRAHEDAPERAVRCGLALVDTLPRLNEELERAHGVRLSIRSGIHTGPVVISEMGGGPRRETLALGDIPNLAARLQGLAEPDTVLISGATLRLVQGIFVTRDLGSREVKGLEAPMRVHQALQRSGMRSQIAADIAAPLVGRDAEIGLLMDRWAQAREGRGHAVAISGDPGIGKSRLVQGFSARLAVSAHTWLECRASAYTRDSALYPVRQLHEQLLGFEADAPRDEKLTLMRRGLESAGFDPEEMLPILAALHGLEPPDGMALPPLSPAGLRKKTLDLLADWLLRLGRQQPVVLLLEDLHWMDPSTLELLVRIIDEMQQSRVLLLLTHRPDFEPTWQPHSHVSPLPLPPLGSEALGELIRNVAAESSLPDAWIAEIARESDGVPLFAEELARSLVEGSPGAAQRPGAELNVPETLEDLLMARLDQLGPAKEVAQIGSVIGREFSYSLLKALWPPTDRGLGDGLSQAVRQEYLFQRGTPPDARYVFKHALIRDAAYQSLLRKTRRRTHAQAARAIQDLTPEVATAQPELVAHHWTEAGDVDEAVGGWQRAGELAVSRAADREAIHHLERALSLIESLPEGPERNAHELEAQLTLGHALMSIRGWGHEETRAAWERANELCDAESAPLRSGIISCGLGDSHATAGDLDGAIGHFDAAGRLGETKGEDLLVLERHAGLAMVLFYQGRYAEALQHVEAGLASYDPKRHHFLDNGFYEEKGINLLCWSSWVCWNVGQPDRGWALATRAVDEARERSDPFALAFALTWASTTALLRRDWAMAGNLGRESAHVGAEQGFSMLGAIGALVAVFSEGIESGDPETADRFMVPLMQASATGNQLGVSFILGFLAELQLHLGRIDAAIATVDGALAAAKASGQHCYDARLLELRGEALRRTPGSEDAEVERLFRSAVETAHGQSARSLELRAATSLAAFLHNRERSDEATAVLRPVFDGFSEGFDTADLKDAKALLDELPD